jgi:hypothetical protein
VVKRPNIKKTFKNKGYLHKFWKLIYCLFRLFLY